MDVQVSELKWLIFPALMETATAQYEEVKARRAEKQVAGGSGSHERGRQETSGKMRKLRETAPW